MLAIGPHLKNHMCEVPWNYQCQLTAGKIFRQNRLIFNVFFKLCLRLRTHSVCIFQSTLSGVFLSRDNFFCFVFWGQLFNNGTPHLCRRGRLERQVDVEKAFFSRERICRYQQTYYVTLSGQKKKASRCVVSLCYHWISLCVLRRTSTSWGCRLQSKALQKLFSVVRHRL